FERSTRDVDTGGAPGTPDRGRHREATGVGEEVEHLCVCRPLADPPTVRSLVEIEPATQIFVERHFIADVVLGDGEWTFDGATHEPGGACLHLSPLGTAGVAGVVSPHDRLHPLDVAETPCQRVWHGFIDQRPFVAAEHHAGTEPVELDPWESGTVGNAEP